MPKPFSFRRLFITLRTVWAAKKSINAFMQCVHYLCPILTLSGIRRRILDKYEVSFIVKIDSVAHELLHMYRRDGWKKCNRSSARMRTFIKLQCFEEKRNSKTQRHLIGPAVREAQTSRPMGLKNWAARESEDPPSGTYFYQLVSFYLWRHTQ